MVPSGGAMSSSAPQPDQTPHQEIELKWALTQAGHERLGPLLATDLGPGHLLDQDNRFFDTPDRRLRQARMNVRLRRENGRVILTCKRKPQGGLSLIDGLAHHDEWEQELPEELVAGLSTPDRRWSDALPLPAPVRAALAGADMHAIGGFRNLRWEFLAERDGLHETVCLDRTDFGVRVDFELEIETNDPTATRRHWQGRFAAWNIAVTAQETTKFARFIALHSGITPRA
jgi:uncharacterized protein YjbK